MEVITEFFTSGDFWTTIIKVLVTVLLTTGLGYLGTLLGRVIARNKESKIYKYAKICVAAAEQKYPNEGKKMGPEKMAYVMDQLAIKFPKIKENTYFYNIAEAAVLELNKDLQREAAIKEFEEKYGEKPIAAIEEEETTTSIDDVEEETIEANNIPLIEENVIDLTEGLEDSINDSTIMEEETAKVEDVNKEHIDSNSSTTSNSTRKKKLSSF